MEYGGRKGEREGESSEKDMAKQVSTQKDEESNKILASYKLSNKLLRFDSFKEMNSPYNIKKFEPGSFQMGRQSSE